MGRQVECSLEGIVKGFYRIKTTLLGNHVESNIVTSAVDHDCGGVPGTAAVYKVEKRCILNLCHR